MTEPKRLLMLDDEAAIGQLVCRVARRAGYEARSCTNAGQFFDELRAWRPTLLPVDLVMPGLDGVEVLSALARERAEANLILVSGFDLRVLDLGELSPDRIGLLCAEFGVPAGRVVLGITETSQVVDTLHATDVLNRLRIKGFGLAIDDYGMGYSSMSQLALFPFTELKIDKTFVDPLTRSSDMRAMVSSMIGLARDMGLSTVAEGVEDASTVSVLRDMGCDAIQGYVIARPMGAGHARAWLSEHAT